MRRDPMFVFALEGALFAFQLKNPAWEPLSQLPPTCRPLAGRPLKIKKHSKTNGGWPPPDPANYGLPRRRDPMVVYAKEGASSAYQSKNPAGEPSPQAPPTRRPLYPVA